MNLLANVNIKEPSNSRQIQLDGGEKQLNTSLLTNVKCTEQPSVNIQVEPNACNIKQLDDNNRLRSVTKSSEDSQRKSTEDVSKHGRCHFKRKARKNSLRAKKMATLQIWEISWISHLLM